MPYTRKTDDRRLSGELVEPLKTEKKFSPFRVACCMLLVATFLLTGCVQPAMAQAPQVAQANTQNVLSSVLNALAGCMVAGQTLIPEEPCDAGTQLSLSGQTGAISMVGMGIAAVSTPPLSSQQALADMGEALGIKSAYAQNVTGSGANVIEPVKILWQIMRNFAYMAYIILFLVVGVMLIFRQKMNAQTVISVQSALPGLVIGLVLITFSYLIAALLVDLAFLFIPMVALIFDQASPTNVFKGNAEFWRGTAIENSAGNYNSLLDLSQNANIFSFWKAYILNLGFTFDLFGNTTTPPEVSITALFQSLLNSLIWVAKGITNILVAAIVIIALFVQMIRLFAMLVRSYISIMAYTFLGPIMILMASIPGRGKAIENWWKTILANALIFPAVFAGFFFGGMILAPNNAIDQAQFGSTLPFFSGLPVQVIKYILGLMIILGTPAIPGMVKEALGVKDMKGIPEMAQAGFGTGGEVIGKGVKKYTGYDNIMKQREALREGILRNKYSTPDDLAHLSRPGWLGGYTERLVAGFQPSYVRSAIGKASTDVAAAQARPTTSSAARH